MKAERSFRDLTSTTSSKAEEFMFDWLAQRYKQASEMEEKAAALLSELEAKHPEESAKLLQESANLLKDQTISRMLLELQAANEILMMTSSALHIVEHMEDRSLMLNSIKQTANSIDLFLKASQRI